MSPATGAGPVPLTVTWNLTAPGSTPPYTVTWLYGFGQQGEGGATSIATSISFLNPGNYTVSVFVNDSSDPCLSYTGSYSVQARAVGPAGTIAITPGNVTGVAPFTESFTANVTGASTPYSINWNGFGTYPWNGTGSTFNVTFPQNGSYYVHAELSDGAGADAADAYAYVTVTGPSVLTATATPDGGVAPLNVTLHASVLDSPAVPTPYAIAWVEDNGSYYWGTTVNLTLPYPNQYGGDQFQVFLVEGPGGGLPGDPSDPIWASSWVGVAVQPSGPGEDGMPWPLVEMTNTMWGTAPFTTTIEVTGYGGTTPYALSICDTGSTGTCWFNLTGWNGSTQTIHRTFPSPGTYSFWGDLHDANGHRATTLITFVQVNSTSGLWATWSSSNLSGAAPLTVQYVGSAGGGVAPYSLLWTFGDGSAVPSAPVTAVRHTYTAGGAYQGQLTVVDAVGTSITYNLSVVRVAGAIANLSAPGPPAPASTDSFGVGWFVGGLRSPLGVLLIGAILAGGYGLLVRQRRLLQREGELLLAPTGPAGSAGTDRPSPPGPS